jgi:CTD small phosphatase-like protein 2
MDKLSFKDASNMIGSSLIDDFSEIDSSEGTGYDYSREVRRDSMASILLDRNLKTPFLPPIAENKEYVLVLDLDETLLHFNEQLERVFVRPFAEKFLLQMSKYYEIVIFTAGM